MRQWVDDHASVLGPTPACWGGRLATQPSVAWPARRLVRQDSTLVVAQRERNGVLTPLLDAHLRSLEQVLDVPVTPPGAVRELSVDFAAPLENCSVASVWRFEDLDGEPVYKSSCFLQVIVTVMGG